MVSKIHKSLPVLGVKDSYKINLGVLKLQILALLKSNFNDFIAIFQKISRLFWIYMGKATFFMPDSL